MESSSSPATPSDVWIVLLGRTGVGKSASGNTILGANVFPSGQSLSSVTTACQKHSFTVAGGTVTVVDTPGFYTTQAEDLNRETERSVHLAVPGVHAFLYVLPLGAFTEQEAEVVCLYEQCFGEEVLRYTVVVFTYGDQMDSVPVETVIEQNASLSDFIEECGGRYCVFNNKLPLGSSAARDQVRQLLQVVDGLIRSKGGSCYTAEMLEEVQSTAEERLEEIRRQQEEEKQRQHQENIQRAREETEERVRREEMERIEREKQEWQEEKDSLEKNIREMEEKRKMENTCARHAMDTLGSDTETSPILPQISERVENMGNENEEEKDGQSSTATSLAAPGRRRMEEDRSMQSTENGEGTVEKEPSNKVIACFQSIWRWFSSDNAVLPSTPPIIENERCEEE